MKAIYRQIILLFLISANFPFQCDAAEESSLIEHVQKDSTDRITSRWLTTDEGTIQLCQTYSYEDDTVVETLWGNLSGNCTDPLLLDEQGHPIGGDIESYTTTYLYENDLLMAQYEQSGRSVHYEYHPNSHRIDKARMTIDDKDITISLLYDDEGNEIGRELDEDSARWLARAPPLDSFSNTAYLIGRSITRGVGNAIVNLMHEIYNFLGFEYFMSDLSDNPLVDESFLVLTGTLSEEHHCGVVGSGEISDRIRVTYINGILNGGNQVIDSSRMISNLHGGFNVHYHHNSTDGFTWDVIGALASKVGVVTLQAQHLARSWKKLIQEMGGVDGGGHIIHYAHSLGGADTYSAFSLITPEEKAMISVHTFGSAKIIPPTGLRSCVNYVSKRDGIGLLGALFDGSEYVTFVGSHFGIPLIDHLISGTTYRNLLQILGQDFLQQFDTQIAL